MVKDGLSIVSIQMLTGRAECKRENSNIYLDDMLTYD